VVSAPWVLVARKPIVNLLLLLSETLLLKARRAVIVLPSGDILVSGFSELRSSGTLPFKSVCTTAQLTLFAEIDGTLFSLNSASPSTLAVTLTKKRPPPGSVIAAEKAPSDSVFGFTLLTGFVPGRL